MIQIYLGFMLDPPLTDVAMNKLSHWEFLLWLSGLKSQHSVHEDVGLISGLSQWVKDLTLPQAAV